MDVCACSRSHFLSSLNPIFKTLFLKILFVSEALQNSKYFPLCNHFLQLRIFCLGIERSYVRNYLIWNWTICRASYFYFTWPRVPSFWVKLIFLVSAPINHQPLGTSHTKLPVCWFAGLQTFPIKHFSQGNNWFFEYCQIFEMSVNFW